MSRWQGGQTSESLLCHRVTAGRCNLGGAKKEKTTQTDKQPHIHTPKETGGDSRRHETTLLCFLLLSEGGLPGVSLHFSLSIIMRELCEEFFFSASIPEALKPQNINGLRYIWVSVVDLSLGGWWKMVKRKTYFDYYDIQWFTKKKRKCHIAVLIEHRLFPASHNELQSYPI